jgi:hypothetical protein
MPNEKAPVFDRGFFFFSIFNCSGLEITPLQTGSVTFSYTYRYWELDRQFPLRFFEEFFISD